MGRPVSRLLLSAAACLVVALWLFGPGHQSTAQAFNRLAESIVAAKTARFHMELAISGQPKQKLLAYYRAPGRLRQEIGEVVSISDFATGKLVSLIASQKMATVMNITGADKKKMAQGGFFFEELRELLAKEQGAAEGKYRPLGEKEIDGKQVEGFRLDSPAITITMWGDPATGLPVRIETSFNGLPTTEVVMTDFEINVPLEDALFNQTIPEGYKTQAFDVDGSEPGEQDLIGGLRAYHDLSRGEFPETVDMASLMQQLPKLFVTKLDVKNGKGPTDEETKQLMQVALKIGRGFGFMLQLPESADAHYAGKGVKLDTPDRPIFWYKPKDSAKYRVLYADLSLRDADTAPEVAEAVRIGKASQKSKP